MFLNSSPTKSNIYERDWKNFDQENLFLTIWLWIGLISLNQKRKA